MGASFQNVQQKSSSPSTKSNKQSVQPSPQSSSNSLQRCLGNQGYMHYIQAKLKVGQPNDKYEQEADRVADQVLRMPDAAIRAQQSGISSGNGSIQTKPG